MLSIFGISLAIALALWFMGWGAAALLLPQTLRTYQFWLAPWVGLLVINISSNWLSRLGLNTHASLYPIALLGFALLAIARWQKRLQKPIWQWQDTIIAIASLLTLTLILLPLLRDPIIPTTFTLGNNDAQNSAVLGDYLQTHSMAHLPHDKSVDPMQTTANGYMVRWGMFLRPGAWLIYSLFGSLLQLPTHQVFTIALGVFQALYTAIVGIFAGVATGQRFGLAIGLALSAINVNLLFFVYQGFGAQISVQGLLVLGYLLLHEVKRQEKPSFFLLAMLLSSLLTMYPEISPFFLIPAIAYGIWVVFWTNHRLRWVANIGLVLVLTLLLDPLGAKDGYAHMMQASSHSAGWDMPRWALPIDIIGFGSIHTSVATLAPWLSSLLSLPIGVIMVIGYGKFRNRPLGIILASFTLLLLLYLRLVRHYSYGYYKAIGFLMFGLIISFAVGLTALLSYRQQRQEATITKYALPILGLGLTYAVTAQTAQQLLPGLNRIKPIMSSIANIPAALRQDKFFIIDEFDVTVQMWMAKFLGQQPIGFTMPSPYYGPNLWMRDQPMPNKTLMLRRQGPSVIRYLALSPATALWQNTEFSLHPAPQATVHLGGNIICNPLSQTPMCWLGQDSTLLIYSHQSHPVSLPLKITWKPIQPNTTIDLTLNGKQQSTVQYQTAEHRPQQQTINYQLQPGKNVFNIHVHEGIGLTSNVPIPTSVLITSIEVGAQPSITP